MLSLDRICGECQKCCDGTLKAEVLGHKIWPGRSCHFLSSKGCTIYKDRPHDPCRVYKCVWLGDDNFPIEVSSIPLWMRPDLSKVIMSWEVKGDYYYIEALEAGENMNSEILNWLIQYVINNNLNLYYQVEGGWNAVGSKEFVSFMTAADNT